MGLEKNRIKSLSPQKSEKKICGKCGQKKKFVVEIDEKYVDQKNYQMVTYIIGQAYDKKRYFGSSTKHKKKIVGRSSPKKKSVYLRK